LHDIQVSLRQKNRLNWGPEAQRQAAVAADGSFVWKGVADGEYEIWANSNCEECYLKSATAGGVDLLEKGVSVKSGLAPSEVELVYSSITGAVNGTVTKSDDLPAVGALVTVVPEPADTLEARRVRNASTDQYGRFEVRGVPPGTYKVFAFEKLDRNAYEDDSFLKPFKDQGASVELSGTETKSVQLRLISAADKQE
jgi:hypothetical protein